jgi:hemolysin activation/secretion protein
LPPGCWLYTISAILISLVSTGAFVWAQERGIKPPTVAPSLPDLDDLLIPLEPEMILPPLPPPPKETAPSLPLPRIFVKKIEVAGSTVFTPAELAKVTAPYENRDLTTEDLEAIRLALTRLYIANGYVTSGAFLPNQTVTNGVVAFRIIEGKLDDIEIEGNKWLRNGYIRRRLSLGIQPPVNIADVQQRLQFLQQDTRIERLQAELRPGVQRGESELHVRVDERLPFLVALGLDNYQSPALGTPRYFITLAHRSLTGHGDVLSGTFAHAAGTELQVDASYALPLTARDTTLILRYQRNQTVVVEAPFDVLDIETKSDTFGISLRQPLLHTLRREFAVTLTADRQRSETFLQGERFSFSPGTEDGEATSTPLRLLFEWTDRLPNQVIASRSRFSFGLDGLGATINDGRDLPDGRFFAWVGQFQWARRLGFLDMETLFRLDVQLANASLLPIDQISVGGRFSVRGYRENQLVRDNGLIVSLETHISLVRNAPWADFVQLTPFVDFGYAWNVDIPTPPVRTIASVGIGLRWALTVHLPVPLQPRFEIYWGYRLKDVETQGHDLQDLGLSLQFVIAALAP